MAAPKKKAISKKKSTRTSKTKKVAKKPAKAKAKTTKKKAIKRAPKRALKKKSSTARALDLRRVSHNPVMSPAHGSYWESEAVFNPGAVVSGGRVHLFYRALGSDGISRVGYASSKDGIHFDKRYPHPVYMPETFTQITRHYPNTSPARLCYDRNLYPSGGGWGGCEDPRAVKIGDRIYMTFNLFNGWYSIQIGLTSISEDDLENGRWNWSRVVHLSPPNQRHKNWVLFPDKVDGKYALFHNLHHPDPSQVRIEYLDEIDRPPPPFESPDPQGLANRNISWHNRTRSIGPPPIKTKYGWLVFYHAMDRNDPGRYKLGAMLLDLKDPRKVLYRSRYPILEPDEWYENDWKPGIIYASGAAVKGDMLYIYYGGGDKHIGVAYTGLRDFINKLMKNEHAAFSVKSSKVA